MRPRFSSRLFILLLESALWPCFCCPSEPGGAGMSSRKHERKRKPRRLHPRPGAPPHAVAHHRRGIALRFASMRAAGAGALAAFLAVLGPGLLAGLSDDDP